MGEGHVGRFLHQLEIPLLELGSILDWPEQRAGLGLELPYLGAKVAGEMPAKPGGAGLTLEQCHTLLPERDAALEIAAEPPLGQRLV